MKRDSTIESRIEENQAELFSVLATLRDEDELRRFLVDLCTPAELTAMADRWKAAQLVSQGLPYRQIYQQSGVSTATVTRVARCLSSGAGGYQLMLDRLARERTRSCNLGKGSKK